MVTSAAAEGGRQPGAGQIQVSTQACDDHRTSRDHGVAATVYTLQSCSVPACDSSDKCA